MVFLDLILGVKYLGGGGEKLQFFRAEEASSGTTRLSDSSAEVAESSSALDYKTGLFPRSSSGHSTDTLASQSRDNCGAGGLTDKGLP